MTILVTGGCGFIGSNFVLDWMTGSCEPVVNLDKLTYAGNPANLASLEGAPGYTFVHGSIDDRETVAAILSRHHARAVVNFAAETHVDRSIEGPEAFVTTNVLGTQRLLEAARDYWSGLTGSARDRFRFLHVSTDEVYGSLDAAAGPFTEASPSAPNSPYAASKAAADHLVRAYHKTYSLPVLTTRCSNNYGPLQFPEKLIPLVICNAIAGKELPIYGDGRQQRDWLHVRDHCAALRLVLDAGSPGAVYNTGGGAERRNIDLVREICAVLDAERPRSDGRSYAQQIVFVKDRPGHDARYAIDASKIRALGWSPKESLETGLRKTVLWYLANPGWVEQVTSGAYRDWVARHYA